MPELRNLKIDPEFRDKIPPLTQDEFNQLRENILTDGEVREPIALWNDTIIDGHNRWKIIQENPHLPHRFTELHFPDKYAVVEWIYKNQLGRRNLTDEQRTVLMGKAYKAKKKSAGGQLDNDNAKKRSAQNGPIVSPKKERTADKLARELGVGRNTIKRAEKFADGVDAIRKDSPEAADKILEGKTGVTKEAVRDYPKAPPSDRSALIDAILKGKPVKRPDGEKPTAAGNLKKLRADYDAIRKNAQAARDPGTVHFDISDLLEEIEVNGNKYVKQLKMTVSVRQDVIADDEARDKVRQAINDIRQAIKEVSDQL